MGHSKEVLSKRRDQICEVGKSILENDKNKEDFDEIIRLLLRISELIGNIARRSNVERRAVKRFLRSFGEFETIVSNE
jgi:hypothetical protein